MLVMPAAAAFTTEASVLLKSAVTAVIDQLTLALTRKRDMTSAFRIGTKMIMLGAGKRAGTIIAEGTPDEIRNHPDPEVQQFIKGEPDGPVPLKLSSGDYIDRLLGHPRQKGVCY